MGRRRRKRDFFPSERRRARRLAAQGEKEFEYQTRIRQTVRMIEEMQGPKPGVRKALGLPPYGDL